jgi:hypothetical protein
MVDAGMERAATGLRTLPLNWTCALPQGARRLQVAEEVSGYDHFLDETCADADLELFEEVAEIVPIDEFNGRRSIPGRFSDFRLAVRLVVEGCPRR